MDTLRKSKPTIHSKEAHIGNSTHSHVGESISDLLIEGKKLANELYEEGWNQVSATEQELEKYADKLLITVRKNPLKSVLIAGGIGFLLSTLLRK